MPGISARFGYFDSSALESYQYQKCPFGAPLGAQPVLQVRLGEFRLAVLERLITSVEVHPKGRWIPSSYTEPMEAVRKRFVCPEFQHSVNLYNEIACFCPHGLPLSKTGHEWLNLQFGEEQVL